MVKRKTYRSRNPKARYQLWTELGERRRATPTSGSGARKGWVTAFITWLFPVDNPARKRRRVARKRGWHTEQLHPNLYRRHSFEPRRVPDQVAAQRAKPRRRRRR
jgi:hypothetical protein